MKKKVLIVTYYWPPAGGPGVQRWLKFVKYLPEFGVQPIVYCPENPSYPITDESLINEIPDDIQIIKHPIREPYRLANLFSKKNAKKISSGVIPKQKKQSVIQKIMLYIRGNFFIPDARKNWVQPSVSFLSKYIVAHNIETIVTTGPPHSLHLIGLELQANLQIKWFADFRDPWTTIGYHKSLKLSKSSKEKHLQLESMVLQRANAIIVTSETLKQEFLAKTKQPIFVITNGYDVHNVEQLPKDEKFSLAHIGSLLSDRNPELLWQALSELILEHSDFRDLFQLKLLGVVSDDVIHAIIKHGLQPHLLNLGYVSHKAAIQHQMSSQVLLMVEIDSEDTKVIIPGKLFEYMVSGTPIIAIGPKGSNVESILNSTNTGNYFNYYQKEEIKSQILSYFEAFKTKSIGVSAVGLEQYSRKSLTKKLKEILIN